MHFYGGSRLKLENRILGDFRCGLPLLEERLKITTVY
jgi:hypothetical protein